jgi:hypothetical protein
VVDLTVSLLGVMVVLPAALVWAEQRGPLTLRDLDPRPAVSAAREALVAAMSQLRRPRLRTPRVVPPRLGLRLGRRRSGA